MATRFDSATHPPAYKWPDVENALAAPEPEPGKKAVKHGLPSRPYDRRSLSYMPALDGLRAVAVFAVLAYHAGMPWARAGFLGVDVFFVISGYLITALLLNEHHRNGRISLARFWRRRAMRLLPGLLVLLAVVSVVIPILAPDQNSGLRGDMVAALTYVSNWWLIFQDQPYFRAIGRPPVLQHLWSLAVEEQFYLLWPIVLAIALRNPFRLPKRLVKWILAAVGASALAMALMYSPEGDASRVYYGTDTRLGTILLGAALAFLWSPGSRTAAPRWVGSFVRDTAGLGSLAAIGWFVVNWNEFEPMLYRGGFTLIALLAAIVVSVASHPGALTKALLGNLPMRWIGQRSYSIYLWHWPVFMLTRPQLDTTLTGIPLLALRIGLTMSLAIASYGLIENPVRTGAIGRAWGRVRTGLSAPRSFGKAATGLAGLMLPLMLGGALAAGTLIDRKTPPPPAQVALHETDYVSTTASTLINEVVVSELTAPVIPTVDPAAAPPVDPAAAPPVDPAAAAPPPPMRVTAIGDSVMVIAKDALAERLGNAVVDAGIGRQTKAVIETAQALKDQGQLGDRVIVHMGTNGLITVKQLNQLMDLLKDVPKVVLVNVKVARPWEEVNNRMLAENVGRFPNATLIDWKGTANAHPEAFYKDGVHLKPSGVSLYVDLLSGSVAG